MSETTIQERLREWGSEMQRSAEAIFQELSNDGAVLEAARGNMTVSSLMADSARRIDELEAIVERLLKTADGVPAVPGVSLYARNYNDIIKVRLPEIAWGPEPMEGRTCGLYYAVSMCYSTEAAAREAMEREA